MCFKTNPNFDLRHTSTVISSKTGKRWPNLTTYKIFHPSHQLPPEPSTAVLRWASPTDLSASCFQKPESTKAGLKPALLDTELANFSALKTLATQEHAFKMSIQVTYWDTFFGLGGQCWESIQHQILPNSTFKSNNSLIGFSTIVLEGEHSTRSDSVGYNQYSMQPTTFTNHCTREIPKQLSCGIMHCHYIKIDHFKRWQGQSHDNFKWKLCLEYWIQPSISQKLIILWDHTFSTETGRFPQ